VSAALPSDAEHDGTFFWQLPLQLAELLDVEYAMLGPLQ